MSHGTIIGRLVATPAEAEVLELVLREMRHARSIGRQLMVTIDAWTAEPGNGVNVFFGMDASGWSTSVEGRFNRARKQAKAPAWHRRK